MAVWRGHGERISWRGKGDKKGRGGEWEIKERLKKRFNRRPVGYTEVEI